MHNKNILLNWLFIAIFTFAILLLMHPFLKYPFDVYHHLLWIQENYTFPNSPKFYWHYFWSNIFSFLDIDNSQIFLRAYIVHYTQTVISYLTIYYFSYTLTKYIFYKSSKIDWHTIAAWATLIWFIMFATASMGYHLVWIQWYSINYQISLPLMFLATAFILNFIFCKNKTKFIYLFLSIVTTLLVLLFHSMEFIYFIMYITLLSILYIDKVFKFLKQNRLFVISIFILFIVTFFNINYFISLVSYKTPKLILFLLNGNFTGLWQTILQEGNLVVSLFNRKEDVLNELIILSLYLLAPMFMVSLYIYLQKKYINFRLIIFLIISSLFVLIPIFQISAGVASVLTYPKLVHRFYYSSTIFIILPTFVYLILIIKKEKSLILLSFILSIIMLSIFYYSRFAIDTPQAFYKNIQSIKRAWSERSVGFNLSKEQINQIGKELKKYENKYGKDIIYFAREDIAFIIKYVYKKDVFLPIKWRGNRLEKDFYIKAYNSSSSKKKVLFKVPKGFPTYEPYR